MPIPPLNKPATMSQRLGFQDPDLTTPEHDAMVFWTKKYVQNKCVNDAESSKHMAFYEFICDEKNKAKNTRKESPYSYNPICNETIDEIAAIQNKIDDYISRGWTYYDQPLPELRSEITKIKQSEIDLIWKNQVDMELAKLDKLTLPEFNFNPRYISDIQLEYPIKNSKNNFILGYADIKVTPPLVSCERDKTSGSIKFKLTPWTHLTYFIEVKPRIQSFGELLRQIRTYQTITEKHDWYVASPDKRFKDDLEDEGVQFIQITEDYKDYL